MIYKLLYELLRILKGTSLHILKLYEVVALKQWELMHAKVPAIESTEGSSWIASVSNNGDTKLFRVHYFNEDTRVEGLV